MARQHLADPPDVPTRERILRVARDLGCLQLDPISVVARSHLIVLWSRLGSYDVRDLDALLWDDRAMFEYWAHAASIVLTEDYPIHRYLMRRYASPKVRRYAKLRAWLAANEGLRRRVLRELRDRGPIRSRDVKGGEMVDWVSAGWTSGRNVTQMLDYLWTKGRIMVVRRRGLEKWWDLAERFLPDWTPNHVVLSERAVTERSAERSLRALGVATPRQIARHFTLNRYPKLPEVLASWTRRGVIVPVDVVGPDGGSPLPGPWYVHASDLDLLDALERDDWAPQTTLLSPFDNLIYERARTELLFGFRYRMEIYVPKLQREFGYYVLPILRGERLIGRVDPAMDRKAGVLRVNAVHAEPDAPKGRDTPKAIAAAVEDLARFLGASSISYDGPVADAWRRDLH